MASGFSCSRCLSSAKASPTESLPHAPVRPLLLSRATPGPLSLALPRWTPPALLPEELPGKLSLPPTDTWRTKGKFSTDGCRGPRPPEPLLDVLGPLLLLMLLTSAIKGQYQEPQSYNTM